MPSHPRSSGRRRAAALLATITISGAGLVASAGAGASPTAPPTPEHVEQVAEQYNLARVKVERASAAIVATERRIHAAEVRVAAVSARVRARAAAMYMTAGSGTALPVMDTEAFAHRTRHRAYLAAAERPDQALRDEMNRELRVLRTEQDAQRAVRAELQQELENAATLKRRLQAEAAAAAASARRSAIDAAGPLATTPPPGSAPPVAAPGGGGGPRVAAPPTGPGTPATTRPATPPPTSPPPTPPPTNPPPAPSAAAATAVAFARAQLGKPYVFATAGPATYDCSGLTMAAWAAAGVRMPHYSGSQATMFPKVSWEQLQPGDIVVFYGDLHHVGIYIGGGKMIHAPQTGDVVKIAPAWRTTFQWGVRPR